MKSRQPIFWCGAVVCVFLLAGSGGALASDGVTLIDQAKIEASGGFPFFIYSPGSYKLSSNLVVSTSDTEAIKIAADDVTLDLNGFNIKTGPGGAGIVAATKGSFFRTQVRNGSITNATTGILLNAHAVVKEVRVNNVADPYDYRGRFQSIVVDNFSIVERNTVNGHIFVECPSVVTQNASEFQIRYYGYSCVGRDNYPNDPPVLFANPY